MAEQTVAIVMACKGTITEAITEEMQTKIAKVGEIVMAKAMKQRVIATLEAQAARMAMTEAQRAKILMRVAIRMMAQTKTKATVRAVVLMAKVVTVALTMGWSWEESTGRNSTSLSRVAGL